MCEVSVEAAKTDTVDMTVVGSYTVQLCKLNGTEVVSYEQRLEYTVCVWFNLCI